MFGSTITRLKNLYRTNRLLFFLMVVSASVVLYLLGATAVFVIVLPIVITLGVYFPSVIKSYFSRYIMSLLFFFGIIQIAATLQFLVLPSSGFNTLALFVGALTLLLVAVFPSGTKAMTEKKAKLFDTHDGYAVFTASIFFIPMFIFIILGNINLIASFGGIQGIDGVNHYASIAEMGHLQHFSYAVGNYYPKGFHIASAFIQTGLGVQQSDLSWMNSARLYVGHYAVWGAILLFGMYYFSSAFTRIVLKNTLKGRFLLAGVALSIGLSVPLFYYTTFMYHGFLSYFYIVAAFIFASLYLMKSYKAFPEKRTSTIKTESLAAIGVLIMTLGVSISWPLWTPVVFLISLLILLNNKASDIKRIITSKQALIIATLIIFHLIPIAFQIAFSGEDSSQGINLTGGLRVFHIGVLTAGMILIAKLIYSKSIDAKSKIVVQQLYVSILILILSLSLMQFFIVGEVRYYTIKTSLLAEMVLIVTAVAIAASFYPKSEKKNRGYVLFVLPVITIGSVSLLLGISGNPLLDARQMFRNISAEQVPAHFVNDTKEFADLGSANSIKMANAVSIHSNNEGILFTHPQAFYWAVMMEHDGDTEDSTALSCVGGVYSNMFKQDFGPSAQKKLVENIRRCADIAEKNNLPFYIITDDSSEDTIRKLFGDVAEVV